MSAALLIAAAERHSVETLGRRDEAYMIAWLAAWAEMTGHGVSPGYLRADGPRPALAAKPLRPVVE